MAPGPDAAPSPRKPADARQRRRLWWTIGPGVIVLLAVALVAFAVYTDVSRMPSRPSVAIPTKTPAPTVLFQSDWSHGLAGWHASAGWSVVDDVLQSDTGVNRVITVPYQATSPDYSVEFRLQIADVPQNGGSFLFAAPPTPERNGYQASVFDLLTRGTHIYADHPTIQAFIDPAIAQDPNTFQPHDYEHLFVARTYRVEVRGPEVIFYVDGRVMTWATSIQTSHLSTGPLTLSCSGAVFRISSIRVLSA